MATFVVQTEPSSLVRSTRDDFNLICIKELYEYLLILSPEGEVKDIVLQEKQRFYNNYQNTAAIYGKPHITLANYIQPNLVEDEVITKLELIAKESNKIKVVLKNYDWFNQHTIYIKVEYQVDIKQLVRKIAANITRLFIINKKVPPPFSLTPHLTLCKNLTDQQYNKSRMEYVGKKFSGDFVACEMILLKRQSGKQKYQIAARFGFNGPEKITMTQQGILF